jgi:hypothetical protein
LSPERSTLIGNRRGIVIMDRGEMAVVNRLI